jgi:hypothetical protein
MGAATHKTKSEENIREEKTDSEKMEENIKADKHQVRKVM